MGCFSFICKECNKPVLSTSFSGQGVTLSLLKEGRVIQSMTGQYDSYGQVFTEDLQNSIQWNDPFPEKPLDESEQKQKDAGETHWIWSRVCDLMFSTDPRNGMAAVHTKCQVAGKLPTTCSEDDPNQGWGEDLELLDDTSSTFEE